MDNFKGFHSGEDFAREFTKARRQGVAFAVVSIGITIGVLGFVGWCIYKLLAFHGVV